MSSELKKFVGGLRQAAFGDTSEGHCVQCKDAFTSANVFTPAGERETHISGMCERCWDKMAEEGEKS